MTCRDFESIDLCFGVIGERDQAESRCLSLMKTAAFAGAGLRKADSLDLKVRVAGRTRTIDRLELKPSRGHHSVPLKSKAPKVRGLGASISACIP